MSCECYKIGGPFIAEDPNCPMHGPGGGQEQINDLEQQVYDLKEQVEALQANLSGMKKFGIQSFSDVEHQQWKLKKLEEENSDARALLKLASDYVPESRKLHKQIWEFLR